MTNDEKPRFLLHSLSFVPIFLKKLLFHLFQLFPLLTTVNNIVFIIIYILQRVRSPVLVALSIICSGAKPPILDIITASKTIMFHPHYHHVICTAEQCSQNRCLQRFPSNHPIHFQLLSIQAHIYKSIKASQWQYVAVYGKVDHGRSRQRCTTMGNNKKQWAIIGNNGQQWTAMGNNEQQWVTMGNNG